MQVKLLATYQRGSIRSVLMVGLEANVIHLTSSPAANLEGCNIAYAMTKRNLLFR